MAKQANESKPITHLEFSVYEPQKGTIIPMLECYMGKFPKRISVHLARELMAHKATLGEMLRASDEDIIASVTRTAGSTAQQELAQEIANPGVKNDGITLGEVEAYLINELHMDITTANRWASSDKAIAAAKEYYSAQKKLEESTFESAVEQAAKNHAHVSASPSKEHAAPKVKRTLADAKAEVLAAPESTLSPAQQALADAKKALAEAEVQASKERMLAVSRANPGQGKIKKIKYAYSVKLANGSEGRFQGTSGADAYNDMARANDGKGARVFRNGKTPDVITNGGDNSSHYFKTGIEDGWIYNVEKF